MNHLSLFGQLSSLPTRQVVQPTVRQPLGHGLTEYLRARGVETRQRYIDTLRSGPLDQKQISAALGVACVRTMLIRMEKEGYVCDAFPGQKRKKQLKLWAWTGKEVSDE